MDQGSAAAADLDTLISSIPTSCHSTTPNIQCCCGHTDCAYLKHNSTALDDLEKDVRQAAQLGQVSKHSSVLFVPPLGASEGITVLQTARRRFILLLLSAAQWRTNQIYK
jgi:hypothetical protein